VKSIKFINNYGTIRYTDTGDINGKLHREDGPAIEYAYGRKEWYLNGINIYVKDNSEFLSIVKLKAFL
jgi:hypothetical protein